MSACLGTNIKERQLSETINNCELLIRILKQTKKRDQP